MLNACVPQKKLIYFQQKADSTATVPYDSTFIAVIHSNDIVNVYVTSLNIEASKYFNYSDRPDGMGTNNLANPGPNGYLVDAFGFIQMPLIGSVKVAGLSSSAARDTIIRKLEKYIENPTVKLNIQNFRVTILGEVGRPGVYYISTEKMTVTDALAMAGDLTYYAKRDNIMIIREENGKKTFGFIDITDRNFLSSKYYNLHSNDIIYLEPFKSKKFQLDNWYRILPIVLSTVSVAIVIFQYSKN